MEKFPKRSILSLELKDYWRGQRDPSRLLLREADNTNGMDKFAAEHKEGPCTLEVLKQYSDTSPPCTVQIFFFSSNRRLPI